MDKGGIKALPINVAKDDCVAVLSESFSGGICDDVIGASRTGVARMGECFIAGPYV
jgi:hypothetical protein